jgi:hypothetical protein
VLGVVLRGETPSMSGLSLRVPRWICDVVESCWLTDPTLRPSSTKIVSLISPLDHMINLGMAMNGLLKSFKALTSSPADRSGDQCLVTAIRRLKDSCELYQTLYNKALSARSFLTPEDNMDAHTSMLRCLRNLEAMITSRISDVWDDTSRRPVLEGGLVLTISPPRKLSPEYVQQTTETLDNLNRQLSVSYKAFHRQHVYPLPLPPAPDDSNASSPVHDTPASPSSVITKALEHQPFRLDASTIMLKASPSDRDMKLLHSQLVSFGSEWVSDAVYEQMEDHVKVTLDVLRKPQVDLVQILWTTTVDRMKGASMSLQSGHQSITGAIEKLERDLEVSISRNADPEAIMVFFGGEDSW